MLTHTQFQRRLASQQEHAWDIDDIPWESPLELEKTLLRVDLDVRRTLGCTTDEANGLSWLLGLMACAAISEHEKVLQDLKRHLWDLPHGHRQPELVALGNQFFAEEAKHAEAFTRYLDRAAVVLGLTSAELKSILPTHRSNSILAWLYRLEASLGGKAVWWAVAATEEESIQLFHHLRADKQLTDPLFYRIHQLHFEEEARHSSFAYLMLGLTQTFFSRFSFLIAWALQSCWLLSQLSRLRRLHALRQRHPMLGHMWRAVNRIWHLPLRQKFTLLTQDLTHIAMMLRPQRHPRIRAQRAREAVSSPALLESK